MPDPRVQTVAWTVAGAVAWAYVLTAWPPLAGAVPARTAMVLAVVSFAASLLEFEAQARVWGRDVQQGITLTESAFVLVLLTVPPGWAWSLTLAGYIAANVVRHPKPLRNLFNGAVWSVSLAAAVWLHELLRPTAEQGITPAAVAAVAAAVLVHAVINYLAISLVVSASTGTDVRRELAQAGALEPWLMVGTLSLGLMATAAWNVADWLLLFVGIVAVILRHGHRQSVRLHDAADQLRVKRDRLDEVVAATEQGLVLTDRAGRVALWNDAMARLTGIPADEALQRELDELLEGRVTLEGDPSSGTGPAPAGSSPTMTSGWLVDGDGQRRRIDVRQASQHDRLGAHVANVTQFRDRTAEYEVARLKDDFLSRVSHELRTPLTTIIGFARTLKAHRGVLDAATVEQLEQGIIRRSEELTALVDDLLLVARTQPGIDTGRTGTVALGAAVERAVEEELGRWPDREVRVEASNPVRVAADPSTVSTVVRHLVSNALKFSPSDTSVDVSVTTTGTGDALLRVDDRGRGIPSSRIEEIFQRFTRLEDPLRMETRGAGMGLHVVERLVADLGGRVEVDSAPGRGATFTVHLPSAVDGVDGVDVVDGGVGPRLQSTVTPS